MSVEKITKEMFHCKCEIVKKGVPCGYEWDTEKIPLRCAGCKGRGWNRPARLTSKAPLTFNGETLTIAQWSRKLGLAKTTIPWRIKQGFPMDQVLSKEDWRKKEESN